MEGGEREREGRRAMYGHPLKRRREDENEGRSESAVNAAAKGTTTTLGITRETIVAGPPRRRDLTSLDSNAISPFCESRKLSKFSSTEHRIIKNNGYYVVGW